MANALRDDNHKPAMIAVQADGTITAGKIDDVTGRLLMSIQHVASLPVPATQVIERDANHVPVEAFATAAGVAKALLLDDTNDGVIATVTIE